MNVTNVGRSLAADPASHSQQITSRKKQAGNIGAYDNVKQRTFERTANVERINQFDLSIYDEVAKYPEQSKINDLLSVSYYV